MEAILLSFCTFFSTAIGGLFALRVKDRLHLIMGFTAGVLLGVVTFDLLPELITQVSTGAASVTAATVALASGFLVFHILEKGVMMHSAHEDEYKTHKHPHVGALQALALCGHSFLDGVGIGLGFQINPTVGILVAVAVIAHDFTDGMNTVTLVLHHGNLEHRAKAFLWVDAIAPVLGAASTLLIHFPQSFLTAYLGFFAGFLLYIGASDILPEAHSQHSSWKTVGLTILGVVFIFIVTRFV